MKTITQKEEQHAAACCSETKNRYICISEESEGACTDTLFETLPFFVLCGFFYRISNSLVVFQRKRRKKEFSRLKFGQGWTDKLTVFTKY